MTDQCPFCQLMQQPEQLQIVGETENFYAWLEYPQPRAKGHANIVPKEHTESVLDFSPEEYSEAMTLVRETMEKAVKGLDADGISVTMNIKEAAGQMLPHAYIQVFPRYEDAEAAGTPTGAIFPHNEELQSQEVFQEVQKGMDSVDVNFEVEKVEPHPDSQKFKESESKQENSAEKNESSSERSQQNSGRPTLDEEQNSRDKEIDLTKRGESIQWQ